MPRRDKVHGPEKRERFNDQALESLQRHDEEAVNARKVADQASADFTMRNEYRRRRRGRIEIPS